MHGGVWSELGEEAFQGEGALQQRCGGGRRTRCVPKAMGARVCAGWALSLEMGAREAGGNEMTRASKAAVRSSCFLHLVLGGKSLKLGKEWIRFVFFRRSREEGGTEGSKLMRLAGKGLIKWQKEWYGLWDLGRREDTPPSIHSFSTSILRPTLCQARAGHWGCTGDKITSSQKRSR